MNHITNDELNSFVNSNIDDFHKSKANILKKLKLKEVLKKKNVYLFKAKNLNSASDLINDILSAFLYSSEEKIFGDFLEKLAIFISSKVCGGRKSGTTGVDLEFVDEGVYYLVSIKSGSSWGNSSSSAKQKEKLLTAVSVIKQGDRKANIQPVIGICYGKQKAPTFKNGIMNIKGQLFWELISGDANMYRQIIEPIGYHAREQNEQYIIERNRIANLFVQEFTNNFCNNGVIDWEKLVEFNSGKVTK